MRYAGINKDDDTIMIIIIIIIYKLFRIVTGFIENRLETFLYLHQCTSIYNVILASQ